MTDSIGTPVLWVGFTLFVLAMLALDLGVFHRRAHEVRAREALAWSVVWIALALLFTLGVWRWFGPERGLEFLTGYLIEKSLSVDNIFVFLVILTYFAVPRRDQHRVLFWGILGAIVSRVIFILAGAALLAEFHWMLYVFGAILILTGVRMLRTQAEVHPERNVVVSFVRRLIPMTSAYHGSRFFVRLHGRLLATPLLLALAAVEATDIVFALDSIPAIFAITDDPFIVYTSNIFAILGLRALFFVVAGLVSRLRYLHVGLGMVLAFVGLKMVAADVYKVPVGLTLIIVAVLIGGAVALSMVRGRDGMRAPAPGPVEGDVS